MRSLRRRILFGAIVAVLLAVIIDLSSAYFLFFYQKTFAVTNIWAPGNQEYLAYAQAPTPALAVGRTLVARIARRADAPQPPPEGASAKVFWNYDPALGWNAAAGVHRLVFSHDGARFPEWPVHHDWTATILPDGSRATGRQPATAGRKMLIFGDSWVFGWALDDELTMAWHLQGEYRDSFAVRNYSSPGWGHTHALINFRRLKDKLTKDDVLIFGYAQYLLPRNPPHPSVIASMSQMMVNYREGPDRPLGYPMARVENGRILVRIAPLDCAKVEGYCSRPDFTLDELEAFTIRLFDEIVDSTPAKVVILQMDGPDDSVLKHLRSRGVTVVDGRPPADMFAKDTMNPYDAHPGPISNHYWFSQLRAAIDKLASSR
jgi:hypothetical protein